MPDQQPVEGEIVGIEEGASAPSNLPAVVEQPQQSLTLFRTDDPQEIVQRATEVADVLSRVLRERNLISDIKGREHVKVEGWTLCGTMLGVFPIVEWTRKLEDGWEARVEARTLSGAIVGSAEAECLRSESSWKSRDDYAIRSMAQTRAVSKALRGPLGFIVQLAGFDPTPLEEMTFERDTAPRKFDPERDLLAGAPRTLEDIGKLANHIDPQVDWRTTWEEAIDAFYGKPRKQLDPQQWQDAQRRMANVVTSLDEGGDFPPPSSTRIEKAFSEHFGGIAIDIVLHDPIDPDPSDYVEDVPMTKEQQQAMEDALRAEAEAMEFGDADQGS